MAMIPLELDVGTFLELIVFGNYSSSPQFCFARRALVSTRVPRKNVAIQRVVTLMRWKPGRRSVGNGML